MARASRAKANSFTITSGGDEPPAAESSPDSPDGQTADQLPAAGEGVKAPRARVTRWNDNMRSYATLDTVTAEVVDEGWIQSEYGGGKYRVYFWGTKKDGTYGYLNNQSKEFIIDDSIPFRGPSHTRRSNGTVHNADGSVAGAPQGSTLMDMGMLQLFKTMQDNSTLMMQQARDHSAAQTAMLERLAAPRESPLVPLLTVLTPLLAPLLDGLIKRKDPMDTARELATLLKPEAAAHNNVKDTIGAFRELMEVRDLLGGGDRADDTGEGRWLGLLEKVIPGALDVLKTEAAKRGMPMPPVRPTMPAPALSPAGTPTPPSAIGTTTSPETAPVADQWTPLEPYAARLAHMAGENKEPYGVMQTIRTMAPAAMVAAIRELVARDDAVVFLTTRFPVLAPYAAWTAQLVEEFRSEFFGESDEEPGEGTPGDTHVEE